MRTIIVLLVFLCIAGNSIANQCTPEQKQVMRNAGLSEAQIRAACQDSAQDFSWLSGRWQVWKTPTSGTVGLRLGIPDPPSISNWDIKVAGEVLSISELNEFGQMTGEWTLEPKVAGSKMEFAIGDVKYILNLTKGNRVVGDYSFTIYGIAGDPFSKDSHIYGKIDMRRW